MEKKQIGFELAIFHSLDEMPKEDVMLLQEAERARQNSYSPYSKFSVGAALMLESGKIVLGSNQENASFPAGLCAEGVTVFTAGANYPKEKMVAIAITSASEEYILEHPAAPCGICRQAIVEYEKKQKTPIQIIMKGQSGPIYKCKSISELLPLGFDSSFL
jgi:cytidine deaminase